MLSSLKFLPTPEPGEIALDLSAAWISATAEGGLRLGALGAAGRAAAIGPGVLGFSSDETVAVVPALPCGLCGPCGGGQAWRCETPRVVDAPLIDPSATGLPRTLTVPAEFCAPAGAAAPGAAALLSPLAAALHAVERAGPVLGRRCMVFGEGLAAAMIVATLRLAGAAWISGLAAGPEAGARLRRAGADAVVDAGAEDAAAEALRGGAGWDVCMDATGSPAALAVAAAALRPGGALVLAVESEAAAAPLAGVAERGLLLRGAAAPLPAAGAALALLRAGRADGIAALADPIPEPGAAAAIARCADRRVPALLLR